MVDTKEDPFADFQGKRKTWIEEIKVKGIPAHDQKPREEADLQKMLDTLNAIEGKGDTSPSYRATGYYISNLRVLWLIYDAAPCEQAPTPTPCSKWQLYGPRTVREQLFRRGQVLPLVTLMASAVVGGTIGFAEGAWSRGRDSMAREAARNLRGLPRDAARSPILSKLVSYLVQVFQDAAK